MSSALIPSISTPRFASQALQSPALVQGFWLIMDSILVSKLVVPSPVVLVNKDSQDSSCVLATAGLLEEWIRSVIQTHKASELFESRNGLYTLYIEWVICERQKILSPLAKQGKLGVDILSYLTC
ncbi:hypothetical protein ZIOFF_068443 [Zingiber officinale]|uniref:Uncharacterized protein n=1 Tax=Zingiber officinale TaxID=94328 RepID=A0A8J5CER6_ZINOF|nr:hypothetical protein ZIOFF_068443 [Zingiber officinale]